MKKDFKDYYNKFLFMDKIFERNDLIVHKSLQRDKPICLSNYFKLISIIQNDCLIFSVSPLISEDFVSFIKDKKIVSVEGNLKEYNNQMSYDYEVKKMIRMSMSKKRLRFNSKINVVMHTRELLLKVMSYVSSDKIEQVLERKKNDLNNGRQFVIVEDNCIVSWAKVSDIDFNAANITVWTSPDHRSKGYGREVVKYVVQWCFDNDYIPVYYVNDDNKASRRLAESIGFKPFSEELVLFENK